MKFSKLLQNQLLGQSQIATDDKAVLAIRYPANYGLSGTSGLSTIYELNAQILSSTNTPALTHPLGMFLFFDNKEEAFELSLKLSTNPFCQGLSWGKGFSLDDEIWMGKARIEADRLAFWAKPKQVLCPLLLCQKNPPPQGIGLFEGKKELLKHIGFAFCELFDHR